MKNKSDPRVIKTKRQLKTALISLLAKQSVESLNIQCITKAAKVTRGTFYLHYTDKHDFVKKVVHDFVKDFFRSSLVDAKPFLEQKVQISEHQVQVFSLEAGFKYIATEYQTFMVLFGLTGENRFNDEIKSEFFYYLRLFSTKLDLKSSTQGIPSSLKNEFIISGLLGMIQDWLAQGMIYTPHFISTKAYELLHQKDSEKVDVSDFFVI
ncbi:TetR/AcrR family transcriptional regulator [Pediococcus damnosus]|nr:TetR/AcrR family transcriptional regulator [Pediococcus damnosus]AMV61402.1 TetR family regulatory protein of MDR cluster [Pediococcus damnosus]AMV65764.1 TetR family regulatory protein of MDR cluster [Pediococcus damnosus]AMV70101.1 TetR family regulatory protein of MDR cluster [Pediococcus damnosus]PIO84662.1 hypothetical protein BSQ37_01295 [Pediococcus damnosus]